MNLKMSKEIKAKWNTVVPIGAGKTLFDIRTSGVESETKSKAPITHGSMEARSSQN